jgi:hypothetical protein
MKNKKLLITALLSVVALQSWADVLELKNGTSINGKYVGGTAGTIRLETAEGIQAIETGQALALTFTGGGMATTAPMAPTTTPSSAAAPAASSVTVPAGTTLLVRMVDSVSSKNSQGKRFTATLDADLTVNGTIVAKSGTKVYGRVQSANQAGRYAGQSKLDLQLTELAVGPNLVPILTSSYTDAGARSGGKTVKGAAVGAGIGAIAGGGEGAGKGAAIGALASGLKKGESLSVGSGTLLEFRLQQPVTVNVTL